jgi:hypothetical protein
MHDYKVWMQSDLPDPDRGPGRRAERTGAGLRATPGKTGLALGLDLPVLVRPAYRDTGTEVADDWEFNLAGGWRFLF